MSKELKYHIDKFDVNRLDLVEQAKYNVLREKGFPKRLALLKLMLYENLSEELQELKDLVNEYDLNKPENLE